MYYILIIYIYIYIIIYKKYKVFVTNIFNTHTYVVVIEKGIKIDLVEPN